MFTKLPESTGLRLDCCMFGRGEDASPGVAITSMRGSPVILHILEGEWLRTSWQYSYICSVSMLSHSGVEEQFAETVERQPNAVQLGTNAR